MSKKLRLILEMSLLFIAMPLTLLLPLHPLLIALLVLPALLYCFWIIQRNEWISKTSLVALLAREHWPGMFTRWLGFCVVSAVIFYFFAPQPLFHVVLNNPLFWLGISVFYAVFSVYPQELIYRYFFFQRYGDFINHRMGMILVNAALFSFAHVAFLDPLIFALTFLGGLLFAITYQRSRSLMLTSIEHAFYGLWLFTLGAGEMLGFPSSI